MWLLLSSAALELRLRAVCAARRCLRGAVPVLRAGSGTTVGYISCCCVYGVDTCGCAISCFKDYVWKICFEQPFSKIGFEQVFTKPQIQKVVSKKFSKQQIETYFSKNNVICWEATLILSYETVDAMQHVLPNDQTCNGCSS